MPGTRAQPKNIVMLVAGYSLNPVVSNQILTEAVAVGAGRVTGIKFNAQAPGAATNTTICDVQINGTSLWSAAAQRPTQVGTAIGEFNSGNPLASRTTVRPGDRITLLVQVVVTTGPSRVMGSVAVEGNA